MPTPHATTPPRDPPILGLAGGIGSGKSSVARELASLGCHVLDFDVLAKAALQRSDVAAKLSKWWGPSVLARTGLVDRAAVARIVFTDPAQRTRLEALIHPLIIPTRARVVADARAAAAAASAPPPRAIVYDAPLLFEAGLDKQCDAVIFVDADPGARAQRVRQTRAWDEPELARREAAQWPLERKRAASRFIIHNNPSDPPLRQQAAGVLAILSV